MNKITRSTFLLLLFLSVAGMSKAQNAAASDTIPASFRKSLNSMLTEYLGIKDALMKGNTAEAGVKAAALHEAAGKANTQGLTKDQLGSFNKQNQKMLVNSQHIADNAKDFNHQCEHFDYLGDEFYALLKKFHFNDATLYYNYSHDANGGNSAHWLTETNSMNDPYFKGGLKTGDKRIEVIQ